MTKTGRKLADDATKIAAKLADRVPGTIATAQEKLAQVARSTKENVEVAESLAKGGLRNATFFVDGVGKGAAKLNNDIAPLKKLAQETAQSVKTTYENRKIDTSEPGIRGVGRAIGTFLDDPQKAVDSGILESKRKAALIRRDLDAKVLKAKNDAEDIALSIEQAKIGSRAASKKFNSDVIGSYVDAGDGLVDTTSSVKNAARDAVFEITKAKDNLGLGVNLLGRSLSERRLNIQKAAQQQSAQRKQAIQKAKRDLERSPLGSLAKVANAKRIEIQRQIAR
jgi:hypothetical protein